MKKIVLSVLSLVVFVLTASAFDNTASKTANVQGKIRVIAPIMLSNNRALDFGVIARGSTNATITIDPIDAPNQKVVSGDAVILSSSAQTSAKFTVSGESGKPYSIVIPTTAQTITSNGNTLNVSDFLCSNGGSAIIGSNDVFYVGATLNVPSNTVSGTYSGTFMVTVAYN